MSCNTQPGAKHVCDFLTDHYGVSIREQDFHLIKDAAREAGLEVSKRAATKEDIESWGRDYGPDAEIKEELIKHLSESPRLTIATVSALRLAKENGLPEGVRARKRSDDSDYHQRAASSAVAGLDWKEKWSLGILTRNPYVLELLGKEALEKIDKGSKEGYLDILADVAKNPATPVSILESISRQQESGHARANVAKNPSAPASILKRLAKDESARSHVADHPNTPASVLTDLSEDEFRVRMGVARNRNTPARVLERIAGLQTVPFGGVRFGGLYFRGQRLSAKDEESVRAQVAGNPNTPVRALEQLSLERSDIIRESLINNPSTPASILERLSVDGNYEPRRRAVYWNEKCELEILAERHDAPAGVLERLRRHKNPKVSKAAIENLSSRIPPI